MKKTPARAASSVTSGGSKGLSPYQGPTGGSPASGIGDSGQAGPDVVRGVGPGRTPAAAAAGGSSRPGSGGDGPPGSSPFARAAAGGRGSRAVRQTATSGPPAG